VKTSLPVVHIDLADLRLQAPTGPAFVILWWRLLPLGELRLGPEPLTAGWFRSLVAQTVAPVVAERLRPGSIGSWLPGQPGQLSPGLATFFAAPRPLAALDELSINNVSGIVGSSISVVVCTRNRPEGLDRTLRALAGQAVRPRETIVVDNAPGGGDAREVARRFADVRYVAQPITGLSAARNEGLRHVRSLLVAFTDDDAEPHPAWIGQLVRTFASSSAVGVTGLAIPKALDTEAQQLFEFEVRKLGQRYLPRRFDHAWFEAERRRATPVWEIGAGVNMAFRRDVFERVGGFDERLGAGKAGCSEDSEMWYRLLAAGYTIDYEPAAVVSHFHRSDMDGLNAQMISYGEGHLAALFAQYGRFRRAGDLRRAFIWLPRYYLRRYLRRPRLPTAATDIPGYVRGLRHWRLAILPGRVPSVCGEHHRPPAGDPARRRVFLRGNPYPHPFTEGFFFKEKMRAIHRTVPPARASCVLEIGGGQSGLTRQLYPHTAVVNIDLDPSYASRATNRHSDVTFITGDATHLPFSDGFFDVVTMFDVLEHIPDETLAAREAMRVLRPGGWLLFSSPNEKWKFPYYRVMRRLCPADVEVMAEWGHVRRGYSLARLQELLAATPTSSASFLSPGTIVAHDLAFSRLPGRWRRASILALTPLTRLVYALARPTWPGTETASAWQKPLEAVT
jgi:GT2 family glycosyltransferase/SAM-dependent methyltransferase